VGVLAAPPRLVGADPTAVPALANFTCGGTSTYEIEVDGIVQQLHAGATGGEPVLLAEDQASGDLVGLCYFSQRELWTIREAICINLISLSAAYRGERMPDGSRIGDYLLDSSVRIIGEIFAPAPMPLSWAIIATDNDASHRLFERNGFDLHLPHAASSTHDVRVRLPGRTP
jgi:hypothetical protein